MGLTSLRSPPQFTPSAAVHAVRLKNAPQVCTEAVVAHLADKRRLCPQSGSRYRYIRRRAARICGKKWDSSIICAGLGQVNQDFANRSQVHKNISDHSQPAAINGCFFLSYQTCFRLSRAT